MDDSAPFAHIAMAEVCLWKRQYDQAAAEAERAIALDPNSASAHRALAEIFGFSGRPAEAIGLLEKAMQLDPHNRELYFFLEGWCFIQMERYAEAIPLLKQHLAHYPYNLDAHGQLVVAYTELGRDDEARAEAAEIMRISPDFSLDTRMRTVPQKDERVLSRFIRNMRKAGVK